MLTAQEVLKVLLELLEESKEMAKKKREVARNIIEVIGGIMPHVQTILELHGNTETCWLRTGKIRIFPDGKFCIDDHGPPYHLTGSLGENGVASAEEREVAIATLMTRRTYFGLADMYSYLVDQMTEDLTQLSGRTHKEKAEKILREMHKKICPPPDVNP